MSSLLEHCRRHVTGEITATQLEQEIKSHAQALEGLSSRDIDRFRDFAARLVHAHFEGATESVMAEFRAWLHSLTQ
jgi:hypothetical protein